MKTKLKLAALIVCALMLASLASACGEKDEAPAPDAADAATSEPRPATPSPTTHEPTTPAPTEPPPPPLVIKAPDDSVDIFETAGISKESLLAYWKFNEINADNKIPDEMGTGRDLFVAPETAKIVSDGAFRGGSLLLKMDERAEFSGKSDDGTKFPEMDEFTVNAWVRIDDVEDIGDCAPIFENDSVFRICITGGGTGGHAVMADENDAWYAGGTAQCWSDYSFEDRFGEWQMLTMTYDGETVTTYLNGEYDGYNDQAGGGGKVKPASRFFIGDPKAAWGTGWNGAADEYSVMSKCLSEDEVFALFMAYAGPQE
jgi:hypothetical protein